METQNNEVKQDTSSSANTSSNSTNTTTVAPASKNTLMGILSYLGILLIIPFMMEKNNSFVKFHLKQGVVLLVIEIAIYIFGMFMSYGMSAILSLLNIGLVVLSIIGIVNVIQGKEKDLPLVGEFSKYVTFL